ncbi:MAG TPA: cbb3-type cytochrome c oxidase subunit I [Trueperaceae bacterium]|nr:cbb3-type cytochrome c oxidase subunit I [Trueperaceae bacterium]
MAVGSIGTTVRAAVAWRPEKRVTGAFLITGLIALLVGALLGPFQAMNYGDVNLYRYLPFLKSYYQGLTLHGVLNALVFTTFFNCGVLIYFPARELETRPSIAWLWASYGVMVFGLVLSGIAIWSNSSTVMYTFYPPLQGSWGFYTGLALVVVGSLMVAFEVVRLRARWRRDNPGKVTPIVTFMSTATMLMWVLASLGIVVEVVVFLIPWSAGWISGVDPQLARTLFWFTGHPIVYFWLLPAYVSWYAFIPKQVGGELSSDTLARMAFVMFMVFSTPVGFHHQFTDPGIPGGWKLVQNILTFFVVIPSLLTAFTVTSSMELGARRKGGRGVLRWIGKLPWGDASFTAQALAMLSFIFGGAGGIVLASFNLNVLVHNTAFIPGHFHITVGTAVTLTFFGMTFWLIPHLTGKRLFSPRLALWSAWTWFVGMMLFAVGMHWQGLLGVPRRAWISNMLPSLQGTYASAAVPQAITMVSGMILFLAVIFYFTVLFGTLFSSRRIEEDSVAIPFPEYGGVHQDRATRALDRLGLWFAVAAAVVCVAYLPTLLHMLTNQVGLPGLRLW